MASSPNAIADRALWQQARLHLHNGRYVEAQRAFVRLLERHPALVPARLMCAATLLAQGRLREACEQTRRAAGTIGNDAALACRVAQALSALGETNAARACLAHPAVASTRSGAALVALAHVHQGLGEHPRALALMERARALGHADPDFRYYRALQLQFNGRLDEAEAEMEACLRQGATLGRASLSLARIRRQRPGANHVDALRARLRQAPAGSEDHAAIAFALHKELDDLDDRAPAWEALQLANETMAARLPPCDSGAEAALFDALVARSGAAELANVAAPAPGSAPVFVVGLPRSGTTLLERVLGNHSRMAAAGELDDFPRQLRWCADRHGHGLLDHALLQASDGIDFALLGQRYLAQTRWRAQGRDFFIDKLPPNFMLLGFIHRALPQARIVHVSRAPMDVCFSNYRAMFGNAYHYSYGFDSLARHHRQYRRLMAHWHAAMPGAVLDLPYELLVRDSEAAARRVFDFCGLPFEPGCGDTRRNTSAVATLSAAQVRQPIHARGIGEWRRYERQLAPLRALVEPG